MPAIKSTRITLLILTILPALFSFTHIKSKHAKSIVKKITIIYTKPTEPGDGPTLYMKFLNGVNKTQTYTFKGNIPLMQLESEKPDGSIFNLRSIQESLACTFYLSLPPRVKDLIISQIGLTGKGWTMRIDDGPEIPIEQKLVNLKM